MKQYVVIRVWNLFKPDVVESFDEYNDAVQFAKLLNKTGEQQHYVYKIAND